MDKVRFAGDLFQDDLPTINNAFPEQEPLEEDDEDCQEEEIPNPGNPITIQDAKGASRTGKQINLSRGQVVQHRYYLRNKSK